MIAEQAAVAASVGAVVGGIVGLDDVSTSVGMVAGSVVVIPQMSVKQNDHAKASLPSMTTATRVAVVSWPGGPGVSVY